MPANTVRFSQFSPQINTQTRPVSPKSGGNMYNSVSQLRQSQYEIKHSAQNSAEHIPLKAPVGETGAGLQRGGSAATSYQRMYLFEAIHAAFHRLRAHGNGQEVETQNIRLKVGPTGDGQLIAAAGATETVVGDDLDPLEHSPDEPLPALQDGDTELIRELAYTSNLHRFLISGGSSMYAMQRKAMPQIRHAGTAGSAMRVMQNRARLLEETHRDDLMTLFRQNSLQRIGTVLNELSPLEKNLQALADTTGAALADDRASPFLQATSSSNALAVDHVGAKATTGEYTIQIDELAQAHVIASDSTHFSSALTLAEIATNEGITLGSDPLIFTINDITIEAESTDTIERVLARINDATATTDTQTGHDVRATFADNRVVFTQDITRGESMHLSDTDGVLSLLGMVREEDGLQVFANETQAASLATLRIDGKTQRFSDNTTTAAIDGLTLSFRETGESTLTVTPKDNAASLAATLQTLLDAYNNAMRNLNRTLAPTLEGTLREQPYISNIYTDLRNATEAPVSGQPDTLATPQMAGIENANDRRVTFHQSQLDAAINARSAAPLPLPLEIAKSPPTVFNALDELGILDEDNNTLRLNEDRLQEVFTETPDALQRLLYDEEDGMLTRLQEAAQNASDPTRGTIQFVRHRLDGLLGGGLMEDAARAFSRSTVEQFEAQIVQSAILSILA